MKKILFIVGSNRKQSFNRQLALSIMETIGSKAETSILRYSDLPMLCQDEEFPAPDAIARIREIVSNADGIWFVTPEYNGSYPALLKNLIDWLSRPVVANDYATPTAIRNKKAIISGVAGKSAAIHSRKKLAELLKFTGVQLYDEEGCGLALDGNAFSTDALVLSDETRDALKIRVDAFLKFLD